MNLPRRDNFAVWMLDKPLPRFDRSMENLRITEAVDTIGFGQRDDAGPGLSIGHAIAVNFKLKGCLRKHAVKAYPRIHAKYTGG